METIIFEWLDKKYQLDSKVEKGFSLSPDQSILINKYLLLYNRN